MWYIYIDIKLKVNVLQQPARHKLLGFNTDEKNTGTSHILS